MKRTEIRRDRQLYNQPQLINQTSTRLLVAVQAAVTATVRAALAPVLVVQHSTTHKDINLIKHKKCSHLVIIKTSILPLLHLQYLSQHPHKKKVNSNTSNRSNNSEHYNALTVARQLPLFGEEPTMVNHSVTPVVFIRSYTMHHDQYT